MTSARNITTDQPINTCNTQERISIAIHCASNSKNNVKLVYHWMWENTWCVVSKRSYRESTFHIDHTCADSSSNELIFCACEAFRVSWKPSRKRRTQLLTSQCEFWSCDASKNRVFQTFCHILDSWNVCRHCLTSYRRLRRRLLLRLH